MSLALSDQLRARIWPELDWSASAPKLAQLTMANDEMPPESKVALLRQLAELCEFCVLDPQVAADIYSACFRNDRSQIDVLPRIRHLCQATGRSDRVARTAELEYRETGDPRFQAIAGQAWLDAGEPDRALKPLLRADHASPGNPHLVAALEVARREWANPDHSAETLLERAHNEPAQRAILGLQAARILCMLDCLDERYEQALSLCLQSQPNLPSACNLMELYLFEEGRLDELAQHFRRRAESAQSPMLATRALFYGSSLLFRAGAGLQAGPLFAAGIEQATRSGMRTIPGLLAQLRALVVTNGNERGRVLEFADQVCDTLESSDEQVGVIIFSAQIALYAHKDHASAGRWMQRLKRFDRQHRLLVDFELADAMMHCAREPSAPPPIPRLAPDERRRADRRAVRANIELGIEFRDALGTLSTLRASTLDISGVGALVHCEMELGLGQDLEIVLSLPSAKGLPQQRFRVRARVVRNVPGQGVGLEWIDPGLELKDAIAALPEIRNGED